MINFELNINEIRKILSNYNIGKLVSYQKAKEGLVNQNWIIKTDKGLFVLRFLEDNKKKIDIIKEHKFEIELSKKINYLVSLPIKSKKDQNIGKYKNRYFWIYNYIDGDTRYKVNNSNIKKIARLIATVHKASENINISFDKIGSPYNVNWIIEELDEQKEYFSKNKNKYGKYFLKIYKSLIKILTELNNSKLKKEYNQLKRIVLHSDYGASNIIWKKDNIIGLIDFDNIRKHPKIYDLAVYIAWKLYKRSKPSEISIRKVNNFLNEYNKYNKLEDNEIKHLPNIILSKLIDGIYWHFFLKINYNDRKLRFKITKDTYKRILWVYKNKKKIQDVALGKK
ncbi:MAG: phosphotransferase [archaeon]